MTGKTAIVLFNLGGPDNLEAVEPFLFNLFNDPAIIGIPNPIRWMLAKFISSRRAPVAREIYKLIGGSSPLLENTRTQAEALSSVLNNNDGSGEFRCFISMRYWNPRSNETVAAVQSFEPDRIVLLPLYPQFSGTTSGSSIGDWHRAAKSAGLNAPTQTICCYPRDEGFVGAVADRVGKAIEKAGASGKPPRVLFSAHGLPQKIVDAGDPYQWQIEQSVEAVVSRLGLPDLDWQVCYQSRVGRLEWLRPYTEDALKTAGKEGVPVVVVPIAFTSEHSETLVELDIEYRELAEEAGVPDYIRVETVRADAVFIDGLVSAVTNVMAGSEELVSGEGGRICPPNCSRCAFAA